MSKKQTKKEVSDVQEISNITKPYLDAANSYLVKAKSRDSEVNARFTGVEEIALITAGVEVVKILLKILAAKLENSDGSNIESMKIVLQSMKETIELERKIEEAQNAIQNNDADLDGWITDND